jgi:hypothetical protein
VTLLSPIHRHFRPGTIVAVGVLALVMAALAAPASAFAYESWKEQIDPGNSLNAVSCVPASTECVVTDSKGNALYSTNLSAKGLFSWKS